MLNQPRTVEDFYNARRQARFESFIARLTGRTSDLLSYEEVRAKLRAIETSGQVLREIPIDAIVGSVGRYADFTRQFLPKSDADRHRWTQVRAIAESLTGFPPIDVYQIGEAYFVRDGNHRVSVSRQTGASSIQAYVTKVLSDVPLEADVNPDDLILKAEYAAFLQATGLRTLVPEVNIQLTAPGKYRLLLEHIEVHRYFMGIEQQCEIPSADAVKDWHDSVYTPLIKEIEQRGILEDFPDRTAGDLYLWVSEHRYRLSEDLEIDVPPGEAVVDLAARFSPQPRRVLTRLGARFYDALTPDPFEGGPRPGHWRRERLAIRTGSDPIFPEILIPLGDQPAAWQALEQAFLVAAHEGAHLHGLHVRSQETEEGALIAHLRSIFLERCEQSGFKGTFRDEQGQIARQVCSRARWMDLVILSLHHPPQPRPLRRLGSGLRTILHRCSRPVLTVPGNLSQFRQLLLAYNGSPKAREALHVAGLLNQRWDVPLHVLHVDQQGRKDDQVLEDARNALLENKQVEFQAARGAPEQAILNIAREIEADLIIIGGYSAHPWWEIIVGSTVERLLQNSPVPLLICR